MFVYGKTATNAIAVISYLAVIAPRRAGSAVIAKARGITPVHTAKLLTQLAAAGYLSGQPGPGGGYTLTTPADEIRLIDVVSMFEKIDDTSPCPFGATWCGKGDPCPLHDGITDLLDRSRRYMEETRLSVFVPPTPRLKRPQSPASKPAGKTARTTRTRRSADKST